MGRPRKSQSARPNTLNPTPGTPEEEIVKGVLRQFAGGHFGWWAWNNLASLESAVSNAAKTVLAQLAAYEIQQSRLDAAEKARQEEQGEDD